MKKAKFKVWYEERETGEEKMKIVIAWTRQEAIVEVEKKGYVTSCEEIK